MTLPLSALQSRDALIREAVKEMAATFANPDRLKNSESAMNSFAETLAKLKDATDAG